MSDIVRRWTLWRLRPALVAWYLAVDVAAVVILVVSLTLDLTAGVVTVRHLVWAGALLVLGIGSQTECSGQVERIRRTVNTVRRVNLTSVWTFAALLLLPTGMACAVAAILLAHNGVRNYTNTRPLHRQVFNPSAVIVTIPIVGLIFTAIAPGGFADLPPDSLGLMLATVAAAVAYWFVDMALVATAVALLADRHQVRRFAMDTTNNALDLATNCIGGLVAVTLVFLPWLVVLSVVPVLVIHRSVLVKELEDKAIRDQKTGLLNATAWRQQTERELVRAGRNAHSLGVVMVDLDHFKRVNDTYGHPAGDDVLTAVAAILRDETRQYDSAGRFGGEEFALLLPESTRPQVRTVAERIRTRIGDLAVDTTTDKGPTRLTDLSASLGVALFPADAQDLPALIQAADSALYTAKHTGRNRVVTAAATRRTVTAFPEQDAAPPPQAEAG